MSFGPHRLVIVGHGAAGLTAAIAAAEAARLHGGAVEITLVEKAAQESAGGNTLWSPSYMRLDARNRIAPDFEGAMMEASGGRGDRRLHEQGHGQDQLAKPQRPVRVLLVTACRPEWLWGRRAVASGERERGGTTRRARP